MVARAVALVAGAVLAGSLCAAAPAGAEPVSTAAFPDCPSARMCLWTGTNGTGRVIVLRTGAPDLGFGGPRPTISSAWNRTTTAWCLYNQRDYRELVATIGPGERGDIAPPTRNRIASARPC